MAGIARCRGLFCCHRNLVATVALGRPVLPQQGILGVLVVIERRGLPLLFIMAGLTLGAEYALVIVVLMVTGKAICLDLILIQVPLMATLALDGFMLMEQRVLGLPTMVEDNLFPATFSMACDALLSKISFMLIVLRVAGQTI